jgi:hypothetical protein
MTIEDLTRRAKQDSEHRRSYLFCMLKDRNCKVSVKICKKQDCRYLEEPEEGGVFDCHCPISMEYVSAFKGNWKKKRRGEKEDLTNEE